MIVLRSNCHRTIDMHDDRYVFNVYQTKKYHEKKYLPDEPIPENIK